jgi:hypothetical protein
LAGVVPEAGETESQVPPAAVDAVAVQAMAEPPGAASRTVCAGGLAAPRKTEKATEPGETLRLEAEACVTAKVCPATVSAPPREAPLALAAAE